MKAIAVIGAGFGDEGKGLMTDYFSSATGLVIRFNGGAQAGHTVVTPAGRRHVFHHLGSGTLKGAATYLSRHFIVNPMLFASEYKELKSLNPTVYIDPRCLLTTPYDMILNEIIEISRGDRRHGSCGCGINETVVRCRKRETTAGFTEKNYEVLEQIAHEYVPERLAELGITDIPQKYKDYLKSRPMMENYLHDCEFMQDFIESIGFIDFEKFDGIVFEGAQGLGLDQNSKNFPYVTRSNTGMKNVREVAGELGITDVETVYVTRCYVTRHGRGPLPYECGKPYPGIVDETNVHNEFQEGLRFGLFNAPDFRDRVIDDVGDSRKSVAVTCLDQADDFVSWCGGDGACEKKHFSRIICEGLHVENIYESWGASRNNVKKVEAV